MIEAAILTAFVLGYIIRPRHVRAYRGGSGPVPALPHGGSVVRVGK